MNRRSLLGMTATSALLLGLPPRRASAQAPGPVMSALSAYMGAAAKRALPDDVIEHAKYHLLDTFAAMISGSELPPGQAAQRYVREHGGNGAITVVASALTAAPIDAALANGVMAHSDETDDSHNESRSHPGCGAEGAGNAVGGEAARVAEGRATHRHDDARADVVTERHGPEQAGAIDAVDLADRERRRHRRAAGMRTRFIVRIVGFIGMRHHAIGERGIDGCGSQSRSDDGDGAVAAMLTDVALRRLTGRQLRP